MGKGIPAMENVEIEELGHGQQGEALNKGGLKMGAFCYVNFRISSTAKIKVNLGKLSMWLPVVEPVPVR